MKKFNYLKSYHFITILETILLFIIGNYLVLMYNNKYFSIIILLLLTVFFMYKIRKFRKNPIIYDSINKILYFNNHFFDENYNSIETKDIIDIIQTNKVIIKTNSGDYLLNGKIQNFSELKSELKNIL